MVPLHIIIKYYYTKYREMINMFGFHLKYFCPKCKSILWFWDVRKKDDCRMYWYKCLNCANEKGVCSRKDALNLMLQGATYNDETLNIN